MKEIEKHILTTLLIKMNLFIIILFKKRKREKGEKNGHIIENL